LADTRCQLECEDWVRQVWMPNEFAQPFFRERVRLRSGGVFDFDAVTADQSIVATISTSGATTSSGKNAVGKLMKLRSDMLFLILAAPKRALMILTEKDMYDAMQKERAGGRVPPEIEFYCAPLPTELAERLRSAKVVSAEEVSPASRVRAARLPGQESL
jgi:hypothetical protein